MEYAGYKKYGRFIDKEVLHADQLNVLWDGIRQNGNEIDKINNELVLINRKEIDSAKEILGFKGKISMEDFLQLPSAVQGDIYQIEDDESTINYFNNKWNLSLKNGDYVICTKSYDGSIRITPANILDYWKVNFQRAFSDASSFESGMVNTGNQSFSGNKVFNDNVTILGNLQLSKNEIYIGGVPVTIPDGKLIQNTINRLDELSKIISDMKDVDSGLSVDLERLRENIVTVNNNLLDFADKTGAHFSQLTEKYNEEIARIFKMLADFDERLKNLFVKTELDKTKLTFDYKEADEQLRKDLLESTDETRESIQLSVEQLQREYNFADDVVRAEMEDADAQLRHDFEIEDAAIRQELKNTEESIREDFNQADQELKNAFQQEDSNIRYDFTQADSDIILNYQTADRKLRVDLETSNNSLQNELSTKTDQLQRALVMEAAQIRNEAATTNSQTQIKIVDLSSQINSIEDLIPVKVDEAVNAALSNFNKEDSIEDNLLKEHIKSEDNLVREEFRAADDLLIENFEKRYLDIKKEFKLADNTVLQETSQIISKTREAFINATNKLTEDLTNLSNQVTDNKIEANNKISEVTERFSNACNTITNDYQAADEANKKELIKKIESATDSLFQLQSNTLNEISNVRVDFQAADNVIKENLTTQVSAITDEFANVRKEISDTKQEVTNAYTSKISTLLTLVTTADTELKNQANAIETNVTSNTSKIQENTKRITELEAKGPGGGGNAGIERLSKEDYDALANGINPEGKQLDPNKFYFIIENNEPAFLYIGEFLIAQKGNANQEFPYVFPIIF